jgi:hypothetical protein
VSIRNTIRGLNGDLPIITNGLWIHTNGRVVRMTFLDIRDGDGTNFGTKVWPIPLYITRLSTSKQGEDNNYHVSHDTNPNALIRDKLYHTPRPVIPQMQKVQKSSLIQLQNEVIAERELEEFIQHARTSRCVL